MDNKKFEALRRFYLEVEKRNSVNGKYGKKTRVGLFSKGVFAPSDLYDVNSGIEHLVATGFIDTSRWFLDAGCGDRRVTALTALVYGIPSIGVEGDRVVFNFGEEITNMLMESQLVNGIPLMFVKGDFTKDKTYHRAGIRFEDIGTVFNYINNERDIAVKIAKQSPRGTVFVLEDIPWIPITSGIPEFEGLTYVNTIPPDLNSRLHRCMHIYRK